MLTVHRIKMNAYFQDKVLLYIKCTGTEVRPSFLESHTSLIYIGLPTLFDQRRITQKLIQARRSLN